MDRSKILVVDLETTSLKPHEGDIIEIGIVSLDNTGVVESVFETVVRPNRPVAQWRDCWAIANTSLTEEVVIGGLSLETIRLTLQSVLNLQPVTAFNRNFDVGFLKHNKFTIHQTIDCPMLITTDILKIPGRRGGYKWPKFQEAWNHFFPECTDYREQHRALDDATHEAQLIWKLKQLGYYKGVLNEID